MKVRVQKYLANQGIASRRAIEKMIGDGRIAVNGKIVEEQGLKIDPAFDRVSIDGEIVEYQDEFVYYWLNKPTGVISAASSSTGETTVVDLIDSPIRIYPVGRLDKDSQGLLLLTNDGELTHRLTHPKYHIDKTYHVIVGGKVTEKKLERLRKGVRLDEGMTAPAEITDHGNYLEFVIHEGKHRQIRRMCAMVDLQVLELTRVAIGPNKIGKLGIGDYRPVTKQEIQKLKQLVKLV